jgi:hypothetical protein
MSGFKSKWCISLVPSSLRSKKTRKAAWPRRHPKKSKGALAGSQSTSFDIWTSNYRSFTSNFLRHIIRITDYTSTNPDGGSGRQTCAS